MGPGSRSFHSLVRDDLGPVSDSIFKQPIRYCEPTGPRKARRDDRLREAIQSGKEKILDCFVATLLAMT
jgi:hypothetical protein